MTIKGLHEFVGMVNFYHRFIPAATSIMRPLYTALAKKTTQREFIFTAAMASAFSEAKTALANAVMLAHPDPNMPISLPTDASDIAVGAVLQQHTPKGPQPLAFFSRQLRPPEQRYRTFDRELLALYLAIRHFRHYLEGRPFTAFTDHKPLTFAIAKVTEPWSARQQRQLSFISEFTTNIQHVAGVNNSVADALSRPRVSALHHGLNFREMAQDQQEDPDVQAYHTAISGLHLADMPVARSNMTLLRM